MPEPQTFPYQIFFLFPPCDLMLDLNTGFEYLSFCILEIHSGTCEHTTKLKNLPAMQQSFSKLKNSALKELH